MILSARLERSKITDWDEYPYHIPAIHSIDTLDLNNPVVLLTGDNGSGKSTLLEAIAIVMGCNPEGGGRNFSFESRSSHSSLHEVLRVARDTRPVRDLFFYRAETFYNLSSEINRLDEDPGLDAPVISRYGGQNLHTLSHGQSVIQLFRHRFREKSIYFLDEPEASLSAARQLEAIGHIHRLVQQGSQFFIATQSPLFLAYPDAKIYELDGEGITQAHGFSEINSISIYKRVVLEGPDFIRKMIFNGDEEA